MADQLPEGHGKLGDGDACPLCGQGVLYRVANTRDGYVLRCFNCGRSGSIHNDEGYALMTAHDDDSPTGFTMTPAQAAAVGEVDPEQAANRVGGRRPAEPAPDPAPDEHGADWQGQ